jgi:type II secretory pathway pseudopilin PulG
MQNPKRVRPSDEGFGLVEIVVSMFILATLAICFLPILVQGIRQSAINSTRATANQIVQSQMEVARSQDPNCSSIAILGAVAVPNVTDSQGVTLATQRTVGACPTTYPGTVRVSVTVTRTDTSAVLVSANTLVYVQVN